MALAVAVVRFDDAGTSLPDSFPPDLFALRRWRA